MFKLRLIDKLTVEQEDHVLKEINYSRKQLKSDVQVIKDWLKEQHHLPPSRLKEEDSFFEIFLTGCKGSLESVKQKIDNYYTIRSHSVIFENRDTTDPGIIKIKKNVTVLTVPNTSKNGERLYIARLSDLNAEDFDFLNYSQMLSQRAEIYLRQAGFSSRIYIMLDFKNASPGLVFKLNPSIFKDLIFLLEQVYPVRIIKLAFFNVPSYLVATINTLIIPLCSQKMRERISISSGLSDFQEYFSPNILPSDYGGESSNPTLKEFGEKWNKCEEESRSLFLNELSEVVDESKRIKTEITTNPYFGVHGSLKKLVID